jgi:hypothetical protein
MENPRNWDILGNQSESQITSSGYWNLEPFENLREIQWDIPAK